MPIYCSHTTAHTQISSAFENALFFISFISSNAKIKQIKTLFNENVAY